MASFEMVGILIFLCFVGNCVAQLAPDEEVDDVDEATPEPFVLPRTSVPFRFGFQHSDEFGNSQHREEMSDGTGVVRGSYGYRDNNGMYRHVSYFADSAGFHAVVRSNEPGIANVNSADVAVVAAEPALPDS